MKVFYIKAHSWSYNKYLNVAWLKYVWQFSIRTKKPIDHIDCESICQQFINQQIFLK